MNVLHRPAQHEVVHGDALALLPGLPNGAFSLVVTSPPYNIGKQYERGKRQSLKSYMAFLDAIVGLLSDKLTDNGSICWQVGNHIRGGELFPLDILSYELFAKRGLKLRNRIIWQFNFGLNASRRFSGRYETLLWYTKGDEYKFRLDRVRVPQLYPGKRHSLTKGVKAGRPSGNPRGKNPGDFWEFSPDEAFVQNPVWMIPNVKANHVEKTIHPCQFPIALAERCILAFTDPGDRVLDPFAGVGTAIVAAAKHGRRGHGIESDATYAMIASDRLNSLSAGTLPYRPLNRPTATPKPNHRVSRRPSEWTSS